jgi:beta-galactosidase GanA
MPKVKARACMLYPRTQTVQMQEEYFNVGLSYELFLRAFGELDILHEEQVKDDRLDGYQVLVLFDVTLLPAEVARRIASFVEHGGVVIADCVPGMDAYKQPMKVMEDLFGVTRAKTDRVRRAGHWVPRVTGSPAWDMRPAQSPDESKVATDAVRGTVLGQPLDLTLVSPRPATVTSGEVLLKTAAGQPAVVSHNVGKGRVFLLGFCCQDTYFRTWQDDKPATREQLAGLLYRMTSVAGVQAHVRSSNPDIEASVRANGTEGFLFVINHEAAQPDAAISLADLGFEIGRIVDLASGQSVRFTAQKGAVELPLSVPIGQTRVLHILRK